MRAFDVSRVGFEVFQVGKDCVRDDLANVFRLVGEDATTETWEDTSGGDVITTEKCVCAAEFVRGALLFARHDAAAFVAVRRCEACARFRSDRDASAAVAAALNRELGDIRFTTTAGGWLAFDGGGLVTVRHLDDHGFWRGELRLRDTDDADPRALAG